MRITKKIAWVLLIALIVIQFIRPKKNLSDSAGDAVFMSETNPPKDVRLILRSSCYDCHSNNTNYPWYSNIAPVSFWVADHINHGKSHLNFSEWANNDNQKKAHKMEEVVETVKSSEMPLAEYTWTHSHARLSDQQRMAVIEWAEKTRVLYELGPQPQ